MSEKYAPSGPLVLVHVEDPPGRARCSNAFTMPIDNAPGRYPRLACPACAQTGTYRDGMIAGWNELRALLVGASISWRTVEGKRAFAELIESLPEGPR